MAKGKTNAVRLLDAAGIEYKMHEYDNKDGKIDGVSVAHKIGIEPGRVFKTLVTEGAGGLFVFVVPVEAELDLKRAARAAGEKKVDMLPVKEIQKQTGYIRGGCSPVGMKKLYPTFIDTQAKEFESIVVSAGRIGAQIELSPRKLAEAVNASFCEIVNNS
ncbi:Cys-tRNA(Pro) deacylase [Domibacillus sp. DTU_2020_1001157_1_SI_ALB_TIR_016]|uniref:Cys-tRNA(Pro) deacylase n=1 Tax=Domibacillus sp. DTU_2020_1001157_1_SI_ALB_TIR_016 TaxID=3077789 RepID=UPI0028E3DBFC|nr:Cys-tRNA(Pro) deacylase [Domibacillus sp. DTU_2020_1001157_1_SI_ALB_TIR_016]WNS81061.1 Cys-tRNA(Pro) deacylase [Domibacillus sp. DTU_2020_1001157_1_SI_ALB_TIR_016]